MVSKMITLDVPRKAHAFDGAYSHFIAIFKVHTCAAIWHEHEAPKMWQKEF